jgi:hypothetical protein
MQLLQLKITLLKRGCLSGKLDFSWYKVLIEFLKRTFKKQENNYLNFVFLTSKIS